MKKPLLLALFLAISFPLTTNASIDINLKYGMSGHAVSEFQDLLVSENCLSVSPTGYFGLLTLTGAKCFQTKYGIEATGFVGNLTRTKANEILSRATSDSDAAEQKETGTVTTLVSCAKGDLFDVKTGKPCGKVQEAIQNIQTQVNTVSTKVDTVIQNQTGSVTPPPAPEPVSKKDIKFFYSQNGNWIYSNKFLVNTPFTIKAIVVDDGGNVVTKSSVSMTTPDEIQNITLNGTSDVDTFYDDKGILMSNYLYDAQNRSATQTYIQRSLHFYQFQFTATTETFTLNFSSDIGVNRSVELNAQ